MNIKASLKYQLEDHKRSIIIFYIVILLLYILSIASAWRQNNYTFGYNFKYHLIRVAEATIEVTNKKIYVTGINLATSIFLLYQGCVPLRRTSLCSDRMEYQEKQYLYQE